MEGTIKTNNAGLVWLFQVLTGMLLIILLGLHMIANHFVVNGGLQTYRDVVNYLSNPLILILEISFLFSVTIHAMLGVRAIVFDNGLSKRSEGVVNAILTVLGAGIIVYALWMTFTIISS